jgi:serine/threonine protein kinase
LPENAPEGLCPACLAKVALETKPATPGGTININPMGEAAPGIRVPPDPAQLAAQFPQLEIIELLGMGGMGMVYKARQPRLDRFVALKILPLESAAHPSFAERFNREAKALAKLNNPGIVDVYDFGQTLQYYYFVMEYVDGMNLRRLLNTQTVTPRQALELVVQICTSLQYAHDEGVVHRDIKPENILINKKGQVKIADFGLAKMLGTTPDTALTMSQAAMGTMNYMAPEQRENAQGVDHRADIYSLGVVFYEMLTGEVPMGRFEPPSKKVQVDVRLDEVVLRALEREPARRYQHVSEVKSNVETITSSMPQKAITPGTPEALKPQVPPSFTSYVLKRFVIFTLAWLGTGLCLRWAVGETSLSVGFGSHTPLAIQIIDGILIGCLSLSHLGYAKFILPAAFLLTFNAWLEVRGNRGLTLRQLPPPIRRRLWLWVNGIGAHLRFF